MNAASLIVALERLSGQRVSDVAESIVIAKVAEVGDVLELRAVRDVLSEGSVVDVDLLHDALHCAQS